MTMISRGRATALCTLAATLCTANAQAAVHLVYTGNDDAAFENVGGFLQTTYNLPTPATGLTVLPPLERAVGQTKTGANKRRGLHVPTSASGLPSPAGAGVTSALTNFSPVAGGSDNNFTSGSPTGFQMSRVGTTITYTIGTDSWSQTAGYFADIDAVEFRLRSNAPTAATPMTSIAFSNVVFNDAQTLNQALGSFTAVDGAVSITLFDGIVGDFSVIGSYLHSLTGSQPTGARLASQLKLLDLPSVPGSDVPEPSAWALLIAGFGLVGTALRRRRVFAVGTA